MFLDVALAAVIQAAGIVMFRGFERRTPLWRRVLKFLIILAVTAVISYYLGRTGVLISFGIAMIPVIYVHAIWLPRHGVNGLTGEPKARYYELRGWAPPER